jgi:hypothetical protein
MNAMSAWLARRDWRAWRAWLSGAALVVGAILVVALIQVIYTDWVFHIFPNKMSTRGQFGDLFGAVTAFFTGLAFAGVVVTLFLQRRELEETTALSVIAALVDSYTSRIDTREQGQFRGDLWEADTAIRDKIESWVEEEVAETSGDKEATRGEIEKSVESYLNDHPDSPKVEWLSDPQNRRAFEAWVYDRRRRNHFLAILEDKFESSVSGQRVTREYKRPSAPGT